jgi:hypothetical protein
VNSYASMFLLEKVSELVGLPGVAQLLEGLELDLTYAFVGQGRCPIPLTRGAASAASRRGRISRHKWPTPNKYTIAVGPELIGGCQTNYGSGTRPIWVARANHVWFSHFLMRVSSLTCPAALHYKVFVGTTFKVSVRRGLLSLGR